MKKTIMTSYQFAKNWKTSGAFYETSRRVELEITSRLSTEPDMIFVEFGLGHGNITREILSKIHPSSKLYSFEVNQDFCQYVKERITDARLHIVNESAAQLDNIVEGNVSGIVSSIPLTMIAKSVRIEILHTAYSALKKDTYFSQILYSKRLLKLFNHTFSDVEVVKNIGIPLEYVHHCRK